jgi:UDP-N-acetylenolpyruvoylglucosamine reductase
MSDLRTKIQAIVKAGSVKLNEPLSAYTTLKIGGEADFLVETNSLDELSPLWRLGSSEQVPIKVIGGGSNLLFADGGFLGIVIKLKQAPYEVVTEGESSHVRFPAGYSSHLASLKMLDLGLSGFEAMHGLPGTLGGAVYMNSKWPKEHYQTSDNLISVTYLDEFGELVTSPKANLQFGYGFSSFQNKHNLILSVDFAFQKADPIIIEKKHQEVAAYRKATQPVGARTAGCVFKNITVEEQTINNLPTPSAGYLLDRCGLKGKRVGGMLISPLHANFFINDQQATANDYRQLVSLVRRRVEAQFKLNLIEEVDFVE